MEIFQTILTALTTPNEEIISIGFIPLVYVEVTFSLLLSITFLNIHLSLKEKILYILVIPTISIVSNFFLPPTIRVIINLITIPLFGIFIFKIGILKSILLEILPIIVVLVSQTIWVNFFNIVLNISNTEIEIIPLYRLIMCILDYSSIFLIYIISKKYAFNITLLDNINKKTKAILIVNSIFGIISIITQLYLISFYLETLPFFITLVGLLSIILYFFISLYSLANTTKLALTTTDLEKEKEDNKTLKILHDELRAFKHDLGNIMTTISGYAQTGDIEGLRNYYSQIKFDLTRVNNLSTLSPDVINNPAIYSLLAAKYHNADELGIKINLDVFLNLNNLNMKIYEFTRILGILLDNAIEASKECDEKIINIEIRKDSRRNRQLLIIENTYTNIIDTDKIFEKNYSTKQGNSGLGLWEVRQILKKNTNLNLFTSKDNNFFKQQLEMYNI